MNKYMEEPNGHLINGGDPGVFILKNSSSEFPVPYRPTGIQTIPADDEMLIIPVWQIFGSEELSSVGKAISERTSTPFVMVNDDEIKRIGLSVGESCRISVKNTLINLMVISNNSIPDGIAGLSYNMRNIPYLALPLPGKLKKHE